MFFNSHSKWVTHECNPSKALSSEEGKNSTTETFSDVGVDDHGTIEGDDGAGVQVPVDLAAPFGQQAAGIGADAAAHLHHGRGARRQVQRQADAQRQHPRRVHQLSRVLVRHLVDHREDI